MLEKSGNIIKSDIIFVLYIVFEYLVILLLKSLGLDITNLDNTWQTIVRIVINLMLVAIFFFIYRKSLIGDAKDFKENWKSYLKLGLKYWLIGLVIMILSNSIIGSFLPTPTNEVMVQDSIISNPVLSFVSSVLVAPFIEELIFRKSIYDCFKDSYQYIYIIVSGLLFGYVHLIAGGNAELIYLIPYGTMGIIFAYLYAKTKNIFVPIFFHMLHNFISVMIYFLTLL